MKRRKTPIKGFKLKTRRKGSWFRVRKVVKKANIILEVLDSRDPLGTRSFELEKLIKRFRKKILLVLNKADLIPRNVSYRWIEYFEYGGYDVFSGSAKKDRDMEKLKNFVKRLAKKRRTILTVVGYPNVGKSTIINGLKGHYVAETSPIPGFTKGEKLVRIDEELLIVDTPGLLPSRKVGISELAIKGFIPPEKLRDPLTPTLKFLNEILSSKPEILKVTYGIEVSEPLKFLEQLAAKRGFLIKGGDLNVDDAARVILRDWQSGKLKFYRLPAR